MHSFLYLEPEGTLGRLFCPLDFCSLAGGQIKFKYRNGGVPILQKVEEVGEERRERHRREELAVPSLGYYWLCYSNITRKHILVVTLRKI